MANTGCVVNCCIISNILLIAFALFESESTESWSFFLTNLRQHIIPIALNVPGSGWHSPIAHHVICVRYMASNFTT
ncbi:hypothetical protein Ahy_B06g083259 [Arachis hypogaea]|uniref:Uncharacterized protein n=1 Tax=Arachis hypogaea TaxID=3818 RepID=A0A444YPP7_ARAHY|nr:hypothetical protein Ahy_B06g083259 [Arachis hypogaea]